MSSMITTTMTMAPSIIPTMMTSSMISITMPILTVMSMTSTPSTSASATTPSTSTSTSASVSATTPSASASASATTPSTFTSTSASMALIALFFPSSRLNCRQRALQRHHAAIPLIIRPSIARHRQRVLLASPRDKPGHIRRRSPLHPRIRRRSGRQRGGIRVRHGIVHRLIPRRAMRDHRALRLALLFLEIPFKRIPSARQVRLRLRIEAQSASSMARFLLRRSACRQSC